MTDLGGFATGRFRSILLESGHCTSKPPKPQSDYKLLGWNAAVAIDKMSLFESTKALWPKTIDLSAPEARNKIYRKNERSFSVDDDWRQVAMWAFHQGLGELERQAVAEAATEISPHDLEFATFDKWIRFNLDGDDSWAAERIEWEATA